MKFPSLSFEITYLMRRRRAIARVVTGYSCRAPVERYRYRTADPQGYSQEGFADKCGVRRTFMGTNRAGREQFELPEHRQSGDDGRPAVIGTLSRS